ncbi:unnamed protein product [Oikopleura dioica]|uniref:PIPK domain-containing protein n=1 Tax=Oikopleura dioica TaxID=34765 RepID=E4YZC3_OIKDI|nr:unnamed protein product [Oikopleura dioica]
MSEENQSFVKMEREESANFFDIVKLTKERANEKKNEEFSTKINRKETVRLGKHTKFNETTNAFIFKRSQGDEIGLALQFAIIHLTELFKKNKSSKDDLLLFQDFQKTKKVYFPAAGSENTPKHTLSDFKFKAQSPKGFQYFRNALGISDEDYISTIAKDKLKVMGNPAKSGALMWTTSDNQYVFKTVSKAQSKFLKQMLLGYYMTLHQHPNTFLTKFYGLYTLRMRKRSIRIVVMRNFFPHGIELTHKFDLKGSTISREAGEKEKQKAQPTYRDLDFNEIFKSLYLEPQYYSEIENSIKFDSTVLDAYNIFDYSLLLGVVKPKDQGIIKDLQRKMSRENFQNMVFQGGIPAKDKDGAQCYLYIGIVDMLQEYDLAHKLQYVWKAVKHGPHNLHRVSVQPPGKYKHRFDSYMLNNIFQPKKIEEKTPELEERIPAKNWQKAISLAIKNGKDLN